MFYGFATVLLIAALVTATEFVAAVERPSWRTRLKGFTFVSVGWFAATAPLTAFLVLFDVLGVKPIYTFPSLTSEALGIVAALLFSDFLNYWSHRFLHRFAWPIHAVHHSVTELCAANNYAHFTERVIKSALFALPLSLVTFKFPETPYAIAFWRAGMEFWIHSPTSAHLGPLSWILVDNRWHRIHHSLEAQHIDKNFGILFSFWDRMFGTAWVPAKGEWPKVGVAGTPPPRNVLDYLLMPLRRRRNHEDALEVAARNGRVGERGRNGSGASEDAAIDAT